MCPEPVDAIEIKEGSTFTLRGVRFRVTQVISHSDSIYLEPEIDGKWAGYDRNASLSALVSAIHNDGVSLKHHE